MNINKKASLSVGVPAHNEEKNIEHMLKSVLKQQGENFELENIFVVCDGCTDRTASIVANLAKTYPAVKLFSDGKRTGKAQRLNQIYQMNKSDLLATLDADIVLAREGELEIFVKEMLSDPRIKVVAGHQVPTPADSLMGLFSNASFLLLDEAARSYHGGNNIHCLQGSASLLRKEFARSFTYPSNLISDQGYLYAMATRNSRAGFKLATQTKVVFRAVSTFRDWRILGARTLRGDKESLAKFFGQDILQEYKLPKTLILKALAKRFFIHPIATTGGVAMDLFIRLFPYPSQSVPAGTWEIITSSKKAIRQKEYSDKQWKDGFAGLGFTVLQTQHYQPLAHMLHGLSYVILHVKKF